MYQTRTKKDAKKNFRPRFENYIIVGSKVLVDYDFIM